MVKSWASVEQSQEYMNLPPQNKIQAKNEYWDNVVSTQTNYSILDQKSKESAKTEFFGGRMVSDVPESEFTADNVALKTMGDTVGTATKSMVDVPVNLVKGVGSMVRHPINTVKGLTGAAVGLAQKAIPGEQPQEHYADNIISSIQNRYGGRDVLDERTGQMVPAWAKTISSDPFGFLLDVSVVAGVAGAGLKATGNAAKMKKIADAGSFPLTAKVASKTGTAIKTAPGVKQFFPDKVIKTNQVIDRGITKAVRPTVSGKGNFAQTLKAKERARSAVKTIVENKKGLNLVDEFGEVGKRLPETLDEFSQSIAQTKSAIYTHYDDLLKSSGKQGASVDLTKVANEVKKIATDRVVKIKDPRASKYAGEMYERLSSAGKLGVREADDLIKSYNQGLKAFYNNPSYSEATNAYIDALVANNLRSTLDDVVSGVTGRNFQAIKNKYGALKSIEKEVSQRAIVAGRQNPYGLVDFTDIFSAGDVIGGAATLNPARMVKGLVQMSIKKSIKEANNANNIVKKMFQNVEKYHDPISDVFTPEILSTLPLNMQKAIGASKRAEKLSYQTRALPSPKDVPYNPTGSPVRPASKIIPPNVAGGDIIHGVSPYKQLPSPRTISPDPYIHGKWFNMKR